MIALVTGASGFIGSRLVALLEEKGHEVHLEPNPRIEVCFHLAGYHVNPHRPEDVVPMIRANVEFGTQTADQLPKGCRFIYAGSTFQHVDSEPYKAACLYAASKQAFQDILKFYADADLLDVSTVSFCDTFGPDDRRGKLLPSLIDAARTGNPIDLTSGHQFVDLIHVDDVCAALIQAVAFAGDFQLTGHLRRVRDLVPLVELVTGKPIAANFNVLSNRRMEMTYPWFFADRLPNWSPHITLEQGIKEIWDAGS